jgi:hypothetical protein
VSATFVSPTVRRLNFTRFFIAEFDYIGCLDHVGNGAVVRTYDNATGIATYTANYYVDRISPVSLYDEYLGDRVLYERVCTVHIVENNTHSNAVYYQIDDDDDDDDGDLDGHILIDTDWIGTSCIDETNVGFSIVSCSQFISDDGTFIVKLSEKNARFVFENGTVVEDLSFIKMETWETQTSCTIDVESHSAECCQKWLVKLPVATFGHSFEGKLFVEWNALVFDVNRANDNEESGVYYGRTLRACITVDADDVCSDDSEQYTLENAITGTIYMYNSPDFSITNGPTNNKKRTEYHIVIDYMDCDRAYVKIKPNLNDRECSKYEMTVVNAYFSDPNDVGNVPYYVYQRNSEVFNDEHSSEFTWKELQCYGNLTWQVKLPSFCNRRSHRSDDDDGNDDGEISWTFSESDAMHMYGENTKRSEYESSVKRYGDNVEDGGDDENKCVVKFTVEWRMDPKYKRPQTSKRWRDDDEHDHHQVVQTDSAFVRIECNAHQYWDDRSRACNYRWYTTLFPKLRDDSNDFGLLGLLLLRRGVL